MALNDTQVTNRLRPEYREIYESFRELGMDQEGALRATAGRDRQAGDILISEAGGTVAGFQSLGLNLNEAQTAARGRPSQDRNLLRNHGAALSEQDDPAGNGTGTGNGDDSTPDVDTVIALWIEDIAKVVGMSGDEARAHVSRRLGGEDDTTGDTEQTESAKHRRTVNLYGPVGSFEFLEGRR